MPKKYKKKTKYKKKPNGKNDTGRPSLIFGEVLTKLEYAFSIGCTDDEACIFADINPKTLYRYQEVNPDFRERKELLKKKIIVCARQSIMNGMRTDGKLAMQVLAKKVPKEYGANAGEGVDEAESAAKMDEALKAIKNISNSRKPCKKKSK